MDIIKILDKALKNNGFTEKRASVVNSYYKLFRADLREEKYIFAICNNTSRFLIPDIISINEEAKKVKIYNVVIINQMKTPYPIKVQSKIKEYGMELWDLNRLITMSKVNKISNTNNILNDTSNIDSDSYDPIQDYSQKKSILAKLFKRKNKFNDTDNRL